MIVINETGSYSTANVKRELAQIIAKTATEDEPSIHAAFNSATGLGVAAAQGFTQEMGSITRHYPSVEAVKTLSSLPTFTAANTQFWLVRRPAY